jgi:hypothetical protein
MENSIKEKKVTIVSAFMENVTTPEWLERNNTFKKYTEYFIPLLQVNVNKIIFIDESVIDKYKSYENENTKIIPFIKESNYLYEYMEQITDFELNTKTPEKDTIQYMFTMCYKTEWVKQAIEMSNEKNEFIWLDFGIKHMCNCTNEEFIKKVERLGECKNDKVRIASVWNPDIEYQNNIYRDICWYFAGSIFGGDKLSLLEFAKEMKDTCLEIINTKQTIMWEVNVWFLVYKKLKLLFSPYMCDHNTSIIDHY